MGASKGTGRRGVKAGDKPKPAPKVTLTVRMTRAERKRIRGYAVDCEQDVNVLILRVMAREMDGWYTVRRGGDGPRLAANMAAEPTIADTAERVAS